MHIAFFTVKCEPIVHEPTVSNGIPRVAIYVLLPTQCQHISSSNRPDTLETPCCCKCPTRATLLTSLSSPPYHRWLSDALMSSSEDSSLYSCTTSQMPRHRDCRCRCCCCCWRCRWSCCSWEVEEDVQSVCVALFGLSLSLSSSPRLTCVFRSRLPQPLSFAETHLLVLLALLLPLLCLPPLLLLLAECGDESHCEGVLCQFEQHPDMCDPDEICLQGFDDITGDYINPELIQQAQQEDMNGFRDMEVYEYVSREEALSDPTATVVGVRMGGSQQRDFFTTRSTKSSGCTGIRIQGPTR